MHEEKWDIWNGTQAWGQAQAMTQHTGGMESSTRRDTAHRAWSQAQGMTQHTIYTGKTIHEAMHNICGKIQYMEERTLHGLTHNT